MRIADRDPREWVLIFRATKCGPDGRVMLAKDFGLKAWPIWIRR